MRLWFRKKLLFLLAVLLVYAAFFVTHIHPVQKTSVLGAKTNLLMFTQPESSESPIVAAINNAIKEVDVEVYLLSDKEIVQSLLDACQRGVAVEVLLEQHPFGGGNINQKTKQELSTTCVKTTWANPAFSLTHAKVIVIDNTVAFILNQNLTTSSFVKNREYDIVDTNKEDVAELTNLFLADWRRSSYTADSTTNLLISPLTARSGIESLIKESKQSIDIEIEVIDDQEVQSLLSAETTMSHIRLLLPSFAQVSTNKKAAQQLLQKGIKVRSLNSPYLHAKLIIVDAKKAYIGSVNLTTQSMDNNREVGIIISQEDIISNLMSDFSIDWDASQSIE